MMQSIGRWFMVTVFLLPSVVLAGEVAKTTMYEFGHFTVIDHGDRLEIEGGVFTPPRELPHPPSQKLTRTGQPPRHLIFINYAKSELFYYTRSEEGGYDPVIGYAVVTPAAYPNPRQPEDFALRAEVVRGEVTQIVAKPSWCPLPGGQILRDHAHLKGCFPYGHPQNPMGEYSFHIAWHASAEWKYVRLHGSRLYPERFEATDTYGCTRLHDPAIAELVARLGPTAVADGIEVVAHRKVTLAELVE